MYEVTITNRADDVTRTCRTARGAIYHIRKALEIAAKQPPEYRDVWFTVSYIPRRQRRKGEEGR